MGSERRRFPRLAHPFDGTWAGASGASRCRIADISEGGCFVQSLAMPTAGEMTEVSILIGSESLTLPGDIVYVDPGMGFAVQFRELVPDLKARLHRLLRTIEAGSPSL